MRKNKTLITILILAALVSFVSFFRLEDFYHFAFDQERDYQVVSRIVNEGKITLLGPQALSSTAFFLGPYYYYLSIPFYLLAGKQPSYGAIIPAVINLITAIYLFSLIYRNTKNRPLSFLAALFWASIIRRTSWNVVFIPLITLAIIDFLTRHNLNNKHLFFAIFLTSLGINFHFQFIFFTPLLFIFFIKHFKNQNPPVSSRAKRSAVEGSHQLKKKLILFFGSSLAFVLPFFPLVVFDIRHQFLNLKSAINFFSHSVFQPRDFYFDRNSLTRFLGVGNFIFTTDILTGLLILLAVIYLILRYLPDRKKYLILSLVPITSLVALHFYSEGWWPEYYHEAAITILYFLIVISFSKFIKTSHCLALIALFVAVNFTKTTSFLLLTDDPFSYRYQKSLIQFILRESYPYNRPNITYDFPFGEGLGFGSIREFYEKKEGDHNPSIFFVGYNHNPKHNKTITRFGVYAVSKNWSPPE